VRKFGFDQRGPRRAKKARNLREPGSIPRCMKSLLEEPVLFARPLWAYVLGCIGGAAIALGALVLMLVFGTNDYPDLARSGLEAFAAGAAMLGVSWIAIAKHRRTSMVPTFGCGAIIASLLVVQGGFKSLEAARAGGLLVIYAFAICAVSFVFATELVAARVVAAVAGALALIIAIGETAHAVGPGSMFLAQLMLVSFVILGTTLAISIPALRNQPFEPA